MSEPLPQFNLLRPTTIAEAVKMLQSKPDARICAGGTDLIVNMRHGLVEAETLIDLGAVTEMRSIQADDSGLNIGAGVTLHELTEHDIPAAIRQAVLSIAGPGHRFAATVGGNLCLDTRCQYYNQSHWWRKSNDFCLKYKGDICHVAPKGNRCRAAFSGDLAPAFMVLDAQVEIVGPDGIRQIPLNEMYQEDGADHLTLTKAEIVSRIHLPASRATSGYRKIRIRGAIDFPLAGCAVACDKSSSDSTIFKIAITGTNSQPIMVEVSPLNKSDDVETYFTTLNKAVQKAVSPQRTTITGAHYRRLSIAAMAARLARELFDD